MTDNGDARDASPNATDEAQVGETGAQDNEAAAPDPISLLEAEKTDLKDRLMRSLAEMENLRRRSEREAKDARTYAVAGFARDMLNVADNIRRALDSAREAGGGDSPALKALIEGVELTERDLQATLGRHGVKLLEPEGQKFDPNFHQAMFEIPNDAVASGTVLQVVQTGYAIGERVLRPAMVGVAKGTGAKPAPGSDAANPRSAD